MTLSTRLWARVTKTKTCWLWTGYLKPSGHGQLQRGRRGEGLVPAHVAAYELLVGPVPDGLVLHHLCGVKECVRPAHCQPVTRAEHPGLHAAGECKRGHVFTAENEAWIVRASGVRERWCRACKNARDREYHARKRLAVGA
jgi:hypothetical protein